MLMKIGGLARALAIVLAIVAGFVALTMINVPLVLVVLGLIAGLALVEERLIAAMLMVLVLPMVGAALAHIPMIGTQLGAVALNLQLATAGAVATALAIRFYNLLMDGVMGLAGPENGRKAAAAAR
ncbi:MAG TPA: hypothetical protein VIV07_06675 [Sphingomicrobium sp.]